jgi:hypothetical protein
MAAECHANIRAGEALACTMHPSGRFDFFKYTILSRGLVTIS